MKEVYLAYFDFMGFKEFIEQNEDDHTINRMGHIFRDIEMSLSQGNYHEPSNGIILSDTSKSNINCLNISDTVLFWTNDCTYDSLKELIEVSYEFNWREVTYNFPIRGALVKGKIREVSGKQKSITGGSYSVQCLYGKGLIKAHLKAENQNWSGTVIDESVILDLNELKNGIDFLSKYAIRYKVPYKKEEFLEDEYVFKLTKEINNQETNKNLKEKIKRVFSLDNKSIDSDSVQKKIKNTQRFIDFLTDK